MKESTVEKMIGCCIGEGLIKAPARFTFGVRSNYRDREVLFEVLEVSDQVCTMGKRAEEACHELVRGIKGVPAIEMI